MSGGRPAKEIDAATIRNAAAIGCTVEEIASVVGCSRAHLYDRMKEDPGIQMAIDEGRATGRATLRRNQWRLSEAGNATMLIWLGKQILGQKDRTEMTGENGAPLLAGITVTFVKPKPEG